MAYFRLVDPVFEPCNRLLHTSTNGSPRIKRTIELSPFWEIILPFWRESGVMLDTACNCMFRLPACLETIQEMVKNGTTMIPTSLFSSKETLREIPLDILKKLIFPYYDLYEQTESFLETEDLQYIWEYLWNFVRSVSFGGKLNRFESIFMFDNVDQAKKFQQEIDPLSQRIICRVELKNTKALEKYDAAWLDNVPCDCTFETFMDYATNYWSGQTMKTSNMEYLFSGSYILSKI